MRRPTRFLSIVAALAAAASTLLIAGASPAQATIKGGGLWKVDCMYSHSGTDDPIVYPGSPGASHLHDFFGNAGTNAYSTYNSMIGVKSTCTHNDTGAYWTPALYQNGKRILPYRSIVYYDVRAYKAQKVEAFPKNFMMIAGDKTATTASQVANYIYWGCNDDTGINYNARQPPTNCGSQGIMLRVQFPSCWDGVTVAGNEISHMRSPSGGNCPAGFPHVFPSIGFHATWHLGTTKTGTITFSSGNVYSEHVDFWNTWDQATLQKLVDDCSNTGNHGGPACGHFTGTTGTPGKAVPVTNTGASNPPPATATTAPAPASSSKPTPSTPSTSPTPCVTAAGGSKVALTSANTPLSGGGTGFWAKPMITTAGGVLVVLIVLAEGAMLMRRTRRKYARD